MSFGSALVWTLRVGTAIVVVVTPVACRSAPARPVRTGPVTTPPAAVVATVPSCRPVPLRLTVGSTVEVVADGQILPVPRSSVVRASAVGPCALMVSFSVRQPGLLLDAVTGDEWVAVRAGDAMLAVTITMCARGTASARPACAGGMSELATVTLRIS
jgi:hypothetical protein